MGRLAAERPYYNPEYAVGIPVLERFSGVLQPRGRRECVYGGTVRRHHPATVCAVAALTLALTACASTSTTAPTHRSAVHKVRRVVPAVPAVASPGVEMLGQRLIDGGGCVGLSLDPNADQVTIWLGGRSAEHCSATIRVRVTGDRSVTLAQRVVAQGDSRLIHAVRVGAGGVPTTPGDRLPLTLLSATADPGEVIVTHVSWRLPAGVRGRSAALVVRYRVSRA
jgi:hypothetical protein